MRYDPSCFICFMFFFFFCCHDRRVRDNFYLIKIFFFGIKDAFVSLLWYRFETTRIKSCLASYYINMIHCIPNAQFCAWDKSI